MERVALYVVLILLLQCSFRTAFSVLSADGLSMYEIRKHFFNSSQLNVLWVGSNPCIDEWYGVICDKATSTIVVGLRLSHMQLQGHIPKRLSQLHHLQELWLDQNQLGGTIPIELGNLTNLKSLRLKGNIIKGYIPEKLRGIPDLSYDHEFICTVPADAACATLNPSSTSRQASAFHSDFDPGSPVQNGQLSAQSQQTNIQSHKNLWHGAEFVDIVEKERILLTQSSAPSPFTEPLKGGDKESWTCLCDPGGVLGVQNYSSNGDSFTDCSCSSACKLCVGGQVLDPLMADNGSCNCISPLLIVVQLLNIRLSNYTLSMERNFTRNFAASIQLSPLQVVPVARRGGIVVLDIYIFPYTSSASIQGDMKAIETMLIQKNNSNGDTLQDPILGPFSILTIEKPLESRCMGRASFKFSGKSEAVPGTIVRRFSYSELNEATERFSKRNVIGLGGSSSVYRGLLKDGRAVAVKKLETRNGSDAESEFLIEVELPSRLHHFHLVPLIGYCIESHGRDIQRLLVYEYMPNGNLRDHLDGALGKESLNWITRVRIALGAARGLEYLHEAATPRVLHRDFKSSNILLDSKWRAKVADFGMAKPITNNDVNGRPNSPAKMLGTFGYFAPEYAMMGRASLKSDVFSFGVVLLELISGRRPVNMSLPKGQQSLVIWASPLLQDEKQTLNEIVDPVLKNIFPVGDMLKMAQLSRACLQMDPECRPTMTAAVQVLATLIPENARKSISLSTNGVQIPFSLPWNPDCSDYNFSREDLDLDNSPMVAKQLNAQKAMASSIFEPEINKLCSPRWTKNHTLLLGIEEVLGSQGEPKLAIVKRSSSWSSAEYLRKLTSLTADDPVRRSSEEELLDLTEPRLESFWQSNGLAV